MKKIYLMLAILGFIVPYYFFIRFLIHYGLDLQQFIDFMFANPIATFFILDLVFSTIVFYGFLYQETSRLGIGNWWMYVGFSLVVGLSFALPMFLYKRESVIEVNLSLKG